MIDPQTGRIYRGPGEPPRFMLKDRPVPQKSVLRAAWFKQQTGYDVDPRTVYIAEALRLPYYRERPASHAAFKSYEERFLDDVMELRTSERNTFATCNQQWFWRYVEKLTPNRAATPLWFGSAVHVALAEYYLKGLKRGPHPAETFAEALDGDRKTYVTNEDEELTFTDARELGVDMLNNYVQHYGTDPRFYVLATEQTFALHFKRGGKVYLKYLLTMDGLVRDTDTGQVFILEHKTARDWGILKRLRLDNQAGSYYAAAPHVLPLADLLKPGEQISGIEYNVLRKAKKDPRPQNADGAYLNKDGSISKQQPQPLFKREPIFRMPQEQKTQLQRIQNEARYMEGMRVGNPDYPVLKTPGDHCSWCPFKTMCELHESGDMDAVEGFKQATMKIEDPYLAYHGKAA